MMLEKTERESTKLLCLYSQFPNWLIHFQELDSMLGTKFLQKGAGSFILCTHVAAIVWGSVFMEWRAGPNYSLLHFDEQ